MVTGDRDLIQLVDDDAGIQVLYIGRGIRRLEVLDEAAVRAAYGVTPRQYPDLAILRGDPSDGLPGIPGVGARTAVGLLERYGDLASLRAAVAAGTAPIRPSIIRGLVDGADYLDRAVPVVQVADVPLAEVEVAIPPTPADPQRLADLAERWGVTTSVQRLTEALAKL